MEPQDAEEEDDPTARAFAEIERRSQAMVDAWKTSDLQGLKRKRAEGPSEDEADPFE